MIQFSATEVVIDEAVMAIYRHPKANGYARAYARAYLDGAKDSTQLLYILNNITHLRDNKGETIIKEARQTLKEWSKIL